MLVLGTIETPSQLTPNCRRVTSARETVLCRWLLLSIAWHNTSSTSCSAARKLWPRAQYQRTMRSMSRCIGAREAAHVAKEPLCSGFMFRCAFRLPNKSNGGSLSWTVVVGARARSIETAWGACTMLVSRLGGKGHGYQEMVEGKVAGASWSGQPGETATSPGGGAEPGGGGDDDDGGGGGERASPLLVCGAGVAAWLFRSPHVARPMPFVGVASMLAAFILARYSLMPSL